MCVCVECEGQESCMHTPGTVTGTSTPVLVFRNNPETNDAQLFSHTPAADGTTFCNTFIYSISPTSLVYLFYS